MTERERAWWRVRLSEHQFIYEMNRGDDEYKKMSLMEQAAFDFAFRMDMKQRWHDAPKELREQVERMMSSDEWKSA